MSFCRRLEACYDLYIGGVCSGVDGASAAGTVEESFGTGFEGDGSLVRSTATQCRSSCDVGVAVAMVRAGQGFGDNTPGPLISLIVKEGAAEELLLLLLSVGSWFLLASVERVFAICG